MLTESEKERYDRQIIHRDIGIQGQEKLKKGRVLIAGAGGLGSAIAYYLAAAGVGFLRIIDNDSVELSNLNRQILHWTRDLGQAKVFSAQEKLQQLNPQIDLEPVKSEINSSNICDLAGTCHIIADAMDNLPTRYELNQAALQLKIPLVHGAVFGLEGHTTTVIPKETACLMCRYKGYVSGEKFPVLGTAPGIIGCIQATEVIKYLLGIGDLLKNRLLTYNGLTQKFIEFRLKQNPECSHCS